MVFVGQVAVPQPTGYFHDDAAFFVFWNPDTGKVRTIVQVA
jgi:hypothetical protein